MANKRRVDEDSMLSGFIYGLVIGAVVAIFRMPRLRLKDFDLDQTRAQLKDMSDSVREGVENAIPPDPVDKSMAEGKAAARRRRQELGMEKQAN